MTGFTAFLPVVTCVDPQQPPISIQSLLLHDTAFVIWTQVEALHALQLSTVARRAGRAPFLGGGVFGRALWLQKTAAALLLYVTLSLLLFAAVNIILTSSALATEL
jgi:hypothetical protein